MLASASPRRRELLGGIGLEFEVRPAAIDESPQPAEEPRAHVLRLAIAKARAVGARGELVLAADTIVTIDGAILGKPRDDAEARRMLQRLAGHEHRVLTAVALREAEATADEAPARDRLVSRVEESGVRIRALDAAEIEWYVATGEPADKAGAYALQGIGGLFVTAVAGSSSNVIGLPLHVVWELFAELGYDLRRFAAGHPPPRQEKPLDTLPRS